MKDKRIVIGIVAAVVLLLGGGMYVASSQKSQDAEIQTTLEDNSVPKLKPEDIGLELVLSDDSKKVKFTADKLGDVKTLEWSFAYEADIPLADRGEGMDEGQKVTQEFSGEATVKGSSYESVFRELGTCSSGKCRFDTGVEKVELLMKVTKKDGKVYEVTDSISL